MDLGNASSPARRRRRSGRAGPPPGRCALRVGKSGEGSSVGMRETLAKLLERQSRRDRANYDKTAGESARRAKRVGTQVAYFDRSICATASLRSSVQPKIQD